MRAYLMVMTMLIVSACGGGGGGSSSQQAPVSQGALLEVQAAVVVGLAVVVLQILVLNGWRGSSGTGGRITLLNARTAHLLRI